MSRCPSCGRYLGPYGDRACPYCSARLDGRISLRLVKTAAILLATIGLAGLWLAATHTEVPKIAIGQANATTNLAYVRVEGRCTRTPSYDPRSDYLSFWIADDTGEIHVTSYRAETQQIIEQGRVPAPGDRVEVAGTLRVREDFTGLTVNAPEQLTINRAEPAERTIDTLTAEDHHRRVRVRGEVREIDEPYEGLTLITVRDRTGAIPVAVSGDLIALSRSPLSVTVGQAVEVVAAVSLYQGQPQLVPATTADIKPLAEDVPIAARRFIAELDAADVGQWADVRGAIVSVEPFSAGVKTTLDDGTGTITLLLWQDVYDTLSNQDELDVGAEVRAQGEVSEYRGELELIPRLAEDVDVLTGATSSPELLATKIGDVTSEHVSQILTLRGALGPPETFSQGIKFPLKDETGTIILLLWQNIYDAIPNADQLTPGTKVEVTGQIERYRGDLEIIPQADGVRIQP